MITGNGISQVDSNRKGIHLFWIGPYSWLYSVKGWNIQRRRALRKQVVCDTVDGPLVEELRLSQQVHLDFGWLSYRVGEFDENTPAEIFRLDLDEPTTFVRLTMRVKLGFSFALYRGKVVSIVTPKRDGEITLTFAAPAIDAIVSYILDPKHLQYCIARPVVEVDRSWDNVPYLVRGLQIPIRELDPELNDPAGEFEKAKSRLFDGEEIDPVEFRHLMDMLRPTFRDIGNPRPIDKVILIRDDVNSGFEQLNATAPLLSLVSHPKWRRVMGFGFFDTDPALSPGQVFEYRITGTFPVEDLRDKIYGFHTISSGTPLPACFLLNDLMLRFSQPLKVQLAPGTLSTGKQQMSRRGIFLQEPDQFFWSFPVLDTWSLVIDFPNPIQNIKLEMQEGHDLQYEAWTADILISSQAVPEGSIVSIDLPIPVIQLRLKGHGFLFTIRTTQPLRGLVERHLVLPPIVFENTPLPSSPSILQARNLQEIAVENIQEGIIPTAPTRSALGFHLQWEPSLQAGLNYWPAQEPVPPPLECSLYQLEHRQIPVTDWVPVMTEENWIMGRRQQEESPAIINQGVDLMTLFPEIPVSEQNTGRMRWDDVFDFSLNNDPVRRPLPNLGTTHQYRIRGVDIIGRAGNSWRESNLEDLRKLVPPPVPVGLLPVVNDEPNYISPPGVHARVLVKDAPDLTDVERVQLGSDNNVILLRWGWYPEQRQLDPYVTEFRIYLFDKTMDSIEAELVSVTQMGTGIFRGNFVLESPIRPNAARRTYIQLGGHPFFIRAHQAGTSIQMVLERKTIDANGNLSAPPLGHCSIPVMISSDKMQPQAWTARVHTEDISAEVKYEFAFRNALELSAAHPRAELWVGVSAADDQPYVQDKLFPAQNRNGNESPIVPVRVQARSWSRPVFDIPPPLEEVPRLITTEPEGKPVLFTLDWELYLEAGAIPGVTHIRLERVNAGTVFGSYRATRDDRVMAVAPTRTDPEQEVIVPNPDDRGNIVRALRGINASALEDRYLVFLAGSHPYRASLFEPVTSDPVAILPVTDRLEPQTDRYVYRVRAANAAGLISAGDAVLKMVLRVPSLKPGPVPEIIRASTEPGLIRLSIHPGENISHVVLFYAPAVTGGRGPTAPGSLLRSVNRLDLYPDKILRFRTPAGAFAEHLIKNLSDTDIETDQNGVMIIEFMLEGEPGSQWQVWACTLTRDGIPCEPGGPWRTRLPVLQA